MSRKVVPLPKRAAAACRTREEETRWRGGFPRLAFTPERPEPHRPLYPSPPTPATRLGLIFLFHYLTSECLADATRQSSAARVSRDSTSLHFSRSYEPDAPISASKPPDDVFSQHTVRRLSSFVPRGSDWLEHMAVYRSLCVT